MSSIGAIRAGRGGFMTRYVPAMAGLFLATAFMAAPALADDNSDVCFKETGEVAIAACTRAIQSRHFNGATLATIFNNRAIEYRQLGEYDRAIADYSQAIRLDAEFTGAYAGRGLAYEGKGEIAKAKAEYQKALAAPQKYNDGAWAHETARERLAALAEASKSKP
jgi:tetratricopeptide (TPR) repeat protein